MENKPSVLTQNYELGRLLGQGTFAKVYYARSIRTNESVAIKVIDKEKLFRVGLVDHIKREISIMRIIRHPNIVQLYEVLATKSKIFVVMEYAKGGELFNKVAKGRLKEDDARKYFLQLINAVDFCHSRGVYHRDIKPENLLLDENENLKVSDFGLSALAESKREDGLLHTTCGTPAYVAPEVINKKGYDGAKADVWSCGVLLYVLLAGYIPFHDSNLMEMYRRIGKAEFKCPIWFPPEVRRLLRKILDPNPDTRITIAKIKGSSWCRQGLCSKRGKTETESCTAALVNDNDSGPSEHNNKDIDTKLESVKPSNLNAFDIISFSAGFDLSGLFEEKPLKREARFTSMQPASVIISKLEAIARRLKLKVMKKDKGLLKLEGLKEGRKGPLSIDAEIFEVTPNFHLVEVKKSSGDTLEYQKIIKEDVRPALKDIVWVWHGDQEHHEQQSPQQEELREQAIVRIRWCGNSSLSVLFSDGMADLFTYWKPERDIEQALIALKKGTSLVKYSRKGKPKFRAFRLSHDETTLIWLSHGQEKNLKLSSISRIIPGQRTAVFRRYLRPEKDYLSFSLLYYDGERSLDLICKDKVEAEVWLAGLSSLIGKSNNRHTKSDIFDLTGEGDIFSNSRPFVASLEFSSSINRPGVSVDIGPPDSSSSDAGTDRTNMQIRGSTDGFRISVSSSPSCSSGGSGPDDIESLGDVYIWGGIWSDGVLSDGSASSITTRNDMLTPKALESNVVLDVHQIACGVHHISLVTRQGEVFTWGEESGGRLGHGIGNDCIQPRLVETLALNNIEFVACGEYHTCAVSAAGDLFTWGDGTRNNGLLGHGTDASHWIPKRVSTPLDGLQVLSIACGSWHSALATSDGKLFTFGDGTFGVLGHGDRESVSYPKEIQSLSGLKTIKVACGLWHTAAIVEVMGQSSNVLSRKLFTWGDGGKNRLGHGNRDAYLFPTCVSSLIDYNFHQLACGHTLTVGLTTSGHVFTMGGSSYGQLGNPNSDGRSPCLVQDRLVGEFVEEISCGAYHVAVLTSRSELFTWGRGANGQLGHGDTEDRKTPTLVETLKDRHVKNISCGSNFTSCICLHKWVSGADQSVCSGCRQAFGFTRKRHNCYNCGLVHCHACSSKKAMKAALAPTPGKPHRVCDGCYAKLKAAEAGNPASITRKATAPRYSVDMRERLDRGELKSSRILLSPILAPVKYLEIKSGIHGGKSASMARASQVPSVLQLKDIAFPSTLGGLQYGLKPSSTPTPPPPPPPPQPQPLHLPLSISISPPNSRSCSPYSRRPSPQRSSTPAFSRSVIDSLKKTNELLKQDMSRMQNQIKSLKQKSDVQDMQIQKLQEQAKEAANFGTAESSKCRLAVEFVKSITHQMKEMTEQLPTEVQENESLKSLHAQMEAFVITKEMQSSSIPESLDAFDAHDMPEQRMEEQAADGMRASDSSHDFASASTPPGTSAASRGGGHKEMTEQFEPGVYVTYIQRSSGAKIYKRVKFSKRKFKEQEANEWWKVNKERLLRRYNPPVKSTAPGPGPSSTPGTSSSTSVPAEDNSEEAEPSES